VSPLSVFQPPAEVVGVYEIPQAGSQLVVSFIEVTFDGCVLDGAVHSLYLTIGPRVLGLCQAMIDVVLSAGVFEGVPKRALRRQEPP